MFKLNVKGKKKDREIQAMTLKQSQQAILNKKTAFVIQEAYKTARTNIVFSVAGAVDNGCKVIAVTSASPGEGKTTSTINLAITFAQTGARVLLIDGDLRKPRVHQYLSVVKNNGLSTVLSNQNNFNDVIFRDLKEGLDVLTSGSIPPNPAELLSSEAMGGMLDELKKQYDYIFFDTPPVTIVTDAAALSKYVDGIVMIVREGYTNHESIEHALNLLNIADAKVLGFFVNDVEGTGAGYGGYRSRGYGYGKGYGYKYRYNYRYNYRYGGGEYGEKAEMSIEQTKTGTSAIQQDSGDDEAEVAAFGAEMDNSNNI